MIDIGVNLTNKRFHKDLQQVLERATQAGVVKSIVTGTSVKESEAALVLVKEFPELLRCTAGVHPHDASSWDELVREKILDLVTRPEVVAIGECGLDFNRDFSPRDQQEACFIEQLTIAADIQKPVFLHERDAYERFSDILSDHINNLSGAVVHCFTGSEKALLHYLDMGCYIGITGWVCDERRGDELRRLVPMIPNDRLLVETDAPYLTPRTLKPKPKGGRNEPALLPHIVQCIADLRGESVECLMTTTTGNAKQLFSL